MAQKSASRQPKIAPSGVSSAVKVYGIDNDWNAEALTWNTAGYSYDGEIVTQAGRQLVPLSQTPPWEPITSANYYDVDATDFVATQLGKGASDVSFVVQSNLPTSTGSPTALSICK